jgi:hypothetical protein
MPVRSLVPEMLDALTLRVSAVCDWEGSADVAALLRALGMLDASTWHRAQSLFEIGWKRAESCDPPPTTSVLPPEANTARERLMQGAAAFGQAAGSTATLIRPLLSDDRERLSVRGEAARALRQLGTPLDPAAAALAAVLDARVTRLERERAAAAHSVPTPPESAAAAVAARSLASCAADAELSLRTNAIAAVFVSASYDDNRRFGNCVSDRLCGPGSENLAETLSVCCDYAYTTSRPEICGRGAVSK